MGAEGDNANVKARVFLSYSRANVEAARRLRDALREDGFDAYLDQNDIMPGEPWRDRLSDLIAKAEKIVFLISPPSIGSEVCTWELDHAERLGKTILPVMIADTPLEDVPGRLSRLNLVFMRGESEWKAGFAALTNVLNIDLAWEREKARLSDMALRWDRGGRSAAHLLPRDDQVANAERWRDGRPSNAPAPSELQLEYIAASRSLRSRLQRRVMIGSVAIALTAVALSALAFFQRQEAVRQRELADEARIAAETSELAARREAWLSRRNEARALAGLSEIALTDGHPVEAVTLALSAWPRRSDAGDHEAPEAIKALSNALPTQRERLRVVTGVSYVNDVKFAPNADIVASAEGSEIVLRSIADGSEAARLTGHADEARAIAFSRDGSILLSGGDDNTALVWDVATGAEIARSSFPDAVKDVAISPDDRFAAAAVFLGDVYVWNPETMETLHQFSGFRVGAQSIAFSPEGARLAIGDGGGGVYLLDAASGSMLGSGFDHSGPVDHLAFSPNGGLLASASGGGVVIVRDLTTGEVLQRIDDHVGGVFTLAFTPDGLSVATGGADELIAIWDLASGKAIQRMRGHEGWVSRLAISADGRRLASGGADGTLRLWDIAASRLTGRYQSDPDFSAIAAAPSAAFLALGDDDGGLTMLDLATGTQRRSPVTGGAEVKAISASPDGAMIATGDADGVVHIRRAGDLGFAATIPAHDHNASGVAFSPGGDRLASVSWRGDLKIWDAATGALAVERADLLPRLEAVAYSPDGAFLAVGGVNGAAILNASTLEIVARLEGHEPTRFNDPPFVEALAFSPDSQRLATAGKDGTARIWNLQGEELLRVDEQTRPLFAEYVKDVGFSKDGRSLFTSGEDNAIRRWDIETGVETARFEGAISGAPALAVLGDLNAVAGLDGQGALRIWEAPDHMASVFELACRRIPLQLPAPDEDETGLCNADYAPPRPWWTTPGRGEPAAPGAP